MFKFLKTKLRQRRGWQAARRAAKAGCPLTVLFELQSIGAMETTNAKDLFGQAQENDRGVEARVFASWAAINGRFPGRSVQEVTSWNKLQEIASSF